MKKSLSELSILIADDSSAQRQSAQQICAELGLLSIYTAGNGVEAIAILKDHVIDVVLLDLEMPIMDGVELISAIAQLKFSCHIIILSAKDPTLISSVGTMAQAYNVNVLGTFQKPLQASTLRCSLVYFINEFHYPKNKFTETEIANSPTITGMELNHAIIHGEIALAYQPKLTVKGLLLTSVEALARWNHPEKGIISPLVFIPLAERLGLINLLTYTLYEKALIDKKHWQQMGMRFSIAFSLSPISLANEKLVDWLDIITKKYEVPPQEVTFEITESTVLNQLASPTYMLTRLRLKGFNIAIDDHGIDFAHAQQLSRVPATELKLDQSLVHRVATNQHQRIILANAINLAKSLKLISVAKGVEAIEDYKVLVELGADQMQGFYFSKPLVPDNLLEFVKTGLTKIRASTQKLI